MARLALASILATATIIGAPARANAEVVFADCAGHPRNARGYIIDGSPQCGDQWCIGTTRQRTACLVARRPGCRDRATPMDRQTATECWAPEINVYDWPHLNMFDALMCESRGEERTWNGRGLFQSTSGDGNAIDDFENAYYVKWEGQGPAAWTATYGRWCA